MRIFMRASGIYVYQWCNSSLMVFVDVSDRCDVF